MNKRSNILPLFLIILIILSSQLSALSYSVNKNFSNYNLIYASGKIRHGDLYNLKRKFNRVSKNKQTIVVFNSVGGELNEGLKIGKYLKNNHIGTAVRPNGLCASSCALAFLGGRDLYGRKFMILPRNAKLGYHSFYYKYSRQVELSKIQEDFSSVLEYADYVNAPRRLITKMFQTKSSSMYWIKRRDKALLGLKSGLARVDLKGEPKIAARYASRNQVRYPVARNYSFTQKKFVQYYFSRINSVISANRGANFNNVAYNDIHYKNWLTSSLKYAYLKSIRLTKINQVKTEVIYSMKNGDRICSRTTYNLAQTYRGWRIINKQHNGCNSHSRKVLKRLAAYLP